MWYRRHRSGDVWVCFTTIGSTVEDNFDH